MNNALIPGSLSDSARKGDISLAESFLSADVLILVDNSGSMSATDAPGGLSRKQTAKNELVKLQRKYPGKIALVSFANFPVPSPGGDILACGTTTGMAKALKFAKRADDCGMKIVLITDGEPNSQSETLAIASTFKSRIDAIYIGSEGGLGFDFLQQLMAITGGKAMKSAEPGLLAESETLNLTSKVFRMSCKGFYLF